MNDPLLILTPLMVLLILALIRFTGCKPFGGSDAVTPSTGPGQTPGVPPPPVVPPTYEQLVAGIKGFAAHWRLAETGGNVAAVLGPLNPQAQGQYVTGNPAGTGLKLGQQGALFDKTKSDLAAEFLGTAAYVEVPFVGTLNTGNILSFSVELWLKPDPALGPATQVVISSHRVDTKHGYEIALVKRDNETHQQLRGRVFSPTATNPTEVSIQPVQADGDPKAWRYVVLTYEGAPTGLGTLTLHVRLAKSTSRFQDVATGASYVNVTSATPSTLRFGANHKSNQNADNFFAGRIDEVAFYNVVLTQQQRDDHFDMA